MIYVDVVSDTICPWCYIGKRRFERALMQSGRTDVAVAWRPFQLNPDMPPEGMSRADYLLAKFGDPSGGGIYDRVIAAGHMAGIEFEFEKIGRTPNTVAAHRLIALADEDGRQDAVVEALFQAYFLHGRDLSDLDELAAIGGEAGLSEHTLTRFRTTDACEAEVRAEDSIARQTGVNGVPCFIFDRAFAVSGAHPPDVLASAIDEALSERVAAAE
jgi:predicted DsbA family dithiol-disulfide isomerase